MMQILLMVGLLGVVLVFCVVDLWHLKEMLRTMRKMEKHMADLVKKGI